MTPHTLQKTVLEGQFIKRTWCTRCQITVCDQYFDRPPFAGNFATDGDGDRFLGGDTYVFDPDCDISIVRNVMER